MSASLSSPVMAPERTLRLTLIPLTVMALFVVTVSIMITHFWLFGYGETDTQVLFAEGQPRETQKIIVVIGAGTLTAVLLCALITVWAVSRLSRSLATSDATLAATAMAKGDCAPAQALLPSAGLEGEQLRAALRHTAAQLQELKTGLEEQVRTRTAQLEVANGHAQAACALAEEASRSKNLFLANMSHELRTPLNAIIGYAEMVAEEFPDSATAQRDLSRIGQSARHLLALINDILDFTKLEAGRMRVHREFFSVRPMIDDAVNVIAPLAALQRNRLLVTVAPQLNQALGDALKMRQILINLLSNACKFTSDGEVRLTVSFDESSPERNLLLQVTDTGIGMDEAQQKCLFKPFTTSEAQRRHGGTGLGLAICAHYCQLMTGTISCRSERGQGTTFVVKLPLELPQSLDGTSRIRARKLGTSKVIAASLDAVLLPPDRSILRTT